MYYFFLGGNYANHVCDLPEEKEAFSSQKLWKGKQNSSDISLKSSN